MNRIEAIHQLNLEKKRRENVVWGQYYAKINNGGVISILLQERTAALRNIQNWYDDAVFNINNTPVKEPLSPQTQIQQEAPESKQSPQLQQPSQQMQRSQTSAQKITPNENILKGAENLPQNKPINLGINPIKKDIDGIQNNENHRNEPPLVRKAREQNRTSDIRKDQEEYKERGASEILEENENHVTKKNAPKLSNTECFILLLVGIVSDILNLIPFINILVTLIVSPLLALYFRYKKLPIGATLGAGVLEIIPGLSIIPATIFGIILTILYDRFGYKITKSTY